jgi:hypothetical protein
MELPKILDSFDNELTAIGAEVESISKVPSDLKLNLPEHLASARPYERISCPGIIDIVMLREREGEEEEI